jgi:hypothetical protein
MINVDDKLIREELPKIGVDAFAVLMCITSHINRQNKAWPGIDRLRSMTGLSKERTYKAVKTLVDSGHIERKQKNHSGEFGHIVYRLTTQYLGIFMGVSSFDLPDSDVVPLAAFTEHGKPERAKPEYGKAARISINEGEVINKDEVINEGEGTPAQFHVQVHSLETIPTVECEVPRPAARPTSKISDVQANPNAFSDAAEYFLRLIEAKKYDLGTAAKYAVPYFRHKQQTGKWIALCLPSGIQEEQRWLGEHMAGVRAWADNQVKFDLQRNGTQPTSPAAPVQIRREI